MPTSRNSCVNTYEISSGVKQNEACNPCAARCCRNFFFFFFFVGLALIVKTFMPYYLNLTETKIFSAIQEYEMAMIIKKKRGKHQLPVAMDGNKELPTFQVHHRHPVTCSRHHCHHRTAIQLLVNTLHSLRPFQVLQVNLYLYQITSQLQNIFIHLILINYNF
jgi:hypothetical protein